MPSKIHTPQHLDAAARRFRFRCSPRPQDGRCCLCGDVGFAFLPCPRNQRGQDAGLHCPHWLEVPGAREEEKGLADHDGSDYRSKDAATRHKATSRGEAKARAQGEKTALKERQFASLHGARVRIAQLNELLQDVKEDLGCR